MQIVDVYVEFGWWTTKNQNDDEPELINRLMERYGITAICVASSEAMRSDLKRGNQKIANLLAQNQGWSGYLVVNPNHLEDSADDMRDYLLTDKFVGIVLPPPTLAHPLHSWRTMELIKMARRYDLPFLTFAESSYDAQALAGIVKTFRNIHCLLLPVQGCDWWAVLKIIEDITNIAIVVSGFLTERGIVDQAVALLGDRRVLFGSGMTKIYPACSLGMIQEVDLTDRQRTMILEINARQWLGI